MRKGCGSDAYSGGDCGPLQEVTARRFEVAEFHGYLVKL
jgi:hypothetical protein